MLKLLMGIVKVALFALVVLAVGNMIHWRGRTISDQVRVGLSHAERSDVVGNVKEWTGELVDDVREGARKKFGASEEKLRKPQSESASDSDAGESIAPSERQKLRALIRELNRSQRRN